MDTATFIKALDLEKPVGLDYLGDTFNRLHDLPDSFVGLNWHTSHEFLYISSDVEVITGHSYKNFQLHGVMFLYSVTPPDMIDHIFTTLFGQLNVLEQNPALITEPTRLAVDGAIRHNNGEVIPIRCVSVILDYLPGQRRSYLVLSTYLDMNGAGTELETLSSEAIALMDRLHTMNIEMNPSRFKVFDSFRQLTPRELEIAQLIRNGHNSKKIAEKLSIALHTVTSHRKSLLKKMDAGNTAEMVHMLNQLF